MPTSSRKAAAEVRTEVEVVEGGRAKRRIARCGLLVEDVDGLSGPVLAHARGGRAPPPKGR